MRLFRLLAPPFLAGLAVLIASSNWAPAADLPANVTSELDALEKKREEGLVQARRPLTDLMEKYLEALTRAGNATRADGDQRQLQAVQNEIKRFKAAIGSVDLAILPDPRFGELRRTYIEQLAKREVEALGMVAKVQRCHADALAEIVKALTQAGMIEEARHVLGLEHTARESIKQLDAKVLALSKFPWTAAQEDLNGLGNFPVSMKKRCSKAGRMARLKENGAVPYCEEAVMKALNWLKQSQKEDGSWTTDYPVAMTGFALLAFLGHCETPRSPEYGANVYRAIVYLVNIGMQNNGRLTTKPVNSTAWVYEHAIATYALCEGYTFCSKLNVDIPELDNLIRRAVKMIIDGQGESGGWVYGYAPTKDGDNSGGFWQIQALAAARNTGLFRESELNTVALRALEWLAKAQGNDGSIGYRGDSKTSPGLTGGGVLAFQIWGMGSSSNARAGIDYIRKNTSFKWGSADANLYYHYYNAQVMINQGGKDWANYNRMFRDELLKNQQKDGSWVQTGIQHGPINTHMATCLATLMLEVYYRFVPENKSVGRP